MRAEALVLGSRTARGLLCGNGVGGGGRAAAAAEGGGGDDGSCCWARFPAVECEAGRLTDPVDVEDWRTCSKLVGRNGGPALISTAAGVVSVQIWS